MACIYKITDTTNGKIYIGQTQKTAESRLKSHWKARLSAKTRSGLKLSMCRNSKSNFKVETISSGNFNRKLTDELEKHFIQLHASFLPERGYNLTKGGQTIKEEIWTPELRERQRQRMKITPKSEGFLRQQKDTENKARRKHVLQYDMNGNFIKEWFGIAAMCRELGFNRRRSIVEVLLGIKKSYRGFIFKYKQ